MAYGDNPKMKKESVPSAKSSRDAQVIEKHSVKDGWWKQKKLKGEC